MNENKQNTVEETFGPVIYSYTRAQAIEDGVLIDVSETAKEAGIKLPTAVTAAVFHEYVAVPEELRGMQDESGRLWDILWRFSSAVRSGRLNGEQGLFELIVAKPDCGDWKRRLVTLKAVCGPSDDGSPCISIMKPDED